MEINAYGTSGTSNLNISTKNSSALDMNDFLNLMVAQVTNQDSMNPMENTEFVSQMAQFSALQAMTDLTEISMQGQATSLIGKNVVMASYNSKGELEIQEGVVQKVTIHSGETKLFVNDIEYDYSNVMEVKNESEETVTEMDIATQMLEGVNSIKNFLIKDETVDDSTIEGSQIY
ncbi:flagellar hook assembly protein FlgD [Sedimentibacter sp. B4]|uniref:flagellar hook assembly protein FlgD n=1 Tax=Sedimentibacter sp. B4 TaxID=304766 RepID=UPI0003090B0B|nr:flagellar hook capping FlgD N-terminal domain-containing protein [Sedimentibacter sp. B4]